MIVHASCSVCGFSAEYEVEVNEHGFYEIPDAYCSVDLLLLTQVIDHISENEDG